MGASVGGGRGARPTPPTPLEGVRFTCSKCEYIATQAGYLKRHVKKKHEGVK